MVDTAVVNRKNWKQLLGLWQGTKRIKGEHFAVLLRFSPDLTFHYAVVQRADHAPVFSGGYQMHFNARQCILVDRCHKESLYPVEIRVLNTDQIRLSGLALLDAEYTRADVPPDVGLF